MMMRRFATSFLLCGLVVAPATSGDRVVLATINDEPITLAELKTDFERRHQGHMSILADEEVVRDFLDAAIKRRLFIQEGRRMDLQTAPEIVERVTLERLRVGTQWLYESEIENRVNVTDSEVRDAMPAALVKYEVIRIRTDAEPDARQAHERLVAGEPAEAVAREISGAR
jgi:hypothetical protein